MIFQIISILVFFFTEFKFSRFRVLTVPDTFPAVCPGIRPILFCDQYHLTKKEGAIFAMLLQYKTNEEISDALDITVNTLQKHIQNIFRKTNTTSKWELLRLVSDQTS